MTHTARSPSLFDALIPILFLVLLLSMAVFYFGDNSSSGSNQIALMICAGIATIIGLKNGHKRKHIEKSIVKGISLLLAPFLFTGGRDINWYLVIGRYCANNDLLRLANSQSRLLLC